jgi:hypothetical protein
MDFLLRALFFLFALPALADGSGWLRLATPRFELYTNTSEKVGRETLALFEQAHRAVTGGTGLAPRTNEPLRVFLFRTTEDFEPYRSSASALGYFLDGQARNFIAIRFSGQSTPRIIFHEYVHAVLKPLGLNLPHWLEEGTAEFYSTTVTDGSGLYAGVPARDHLQTLEVMPLLEADTLLHANRHAALYSEPEQAGVYYSQSWALVHMLTMAPGYRERFPHFVSLLKRRVQQERAFALAFGKDPQRVLDDMSTYIGSGRLQSLALPAAPVRQVRISTARPLSADEVESALLELQDELERNR